MFNDATIDAEVSQRIFKADSGFGKLFQQLCKRHDIWIDTKIAVYKAVVLSILLYGFKTWTTCRRHIKKLEAFHLLCFTASVVFAGKT